MAGDSSQLAGDAQQRALRFLDEWKKTLLDLSPRNKLIFFGKPRGIRMQLIEPSPVELYQLVALDERGLDFPYPKGPPIDEVELGLEGTPENPELMPGDISVRYDQETVRDPFDLQRKLYRLRSASRLSMSELGVNTLYLALGFLRWKEAPQAQEVVSSPLLLIPVRLERKRRAGYRLEPQDEGVEVNPALAYLLDHNFGILLPSFDSYDGFGEPPNLPGFLDAVREQVAPHDWTVEPDAWLSQFSFHKMVMYRDLETPGVVEAVVEHPVLSVLSEAAIPSEPPVISDSELDSGFDDSALYPVLPADSSQLEVLARVRAGQSLVVQGPPGTGKSQTIANLVAMALRDGKKILFVSEKRAALEVVFSRLQKLGLSELCLELHSSRPDKRAILGQISQGLAKTNPVPVREQDFERYRLLKSRLTNYASQLHTKQGPRRRTAYEVHGRIAQLAQAPWVGAELPSDSVNPEGSREAELIAAVKDLGANRVWDEVTTHPWREADPQQAVFPTPVEIQDWVHRLDDALQGLFSIRQQVEGKLGLSLGATLDTLPRNGVLEYVGTVTPVGIPEALWDATAAEVEMIREAGNRLELLTRAQQTLDNLGVGALPEQTESLQELGQALAAYGRESSFAHRLGHRRVLKRLFRTVTGRRLPVRRIGEAVQKADEVAAQSEWLAHQEGRLRRLVPTGKEASEFTRALEGIDWLAELRRRLPEGVPSSLQSLLMSECEALVSAAVNLGSQVRVAASDALRALESLVPVFPRGLQGVPLPSFEIDLLAERTREWGSAPERFAEWAAFVRQHRRCEVLGLSDFLSEARNRNVGAVDLAPALERLVLVRELSGIYGVSAALGEFDPATHEQLIEEFRELDKSLEQEAIKATINAVRDAIPAHPPFQEERLLQKELNKKRRHLPPRRLFPQIPTLLMAAKPCLLMSPLSVASYLPRDSFSFDLVIFDEASQVRPGDAIGAILRGQQAAVFGDDKQLPPTDFFETHIEEDDDDSDVTDFESILHVANAHLPRGPRLQWHYRSRDERLIAFANREFYEGELITCPAPEQADDTGVHLELVPNGVFGRGRSRANPVEAALVVDLVVDHVRRWPGRSLGIMTMSLDQRDAVEGELRRRIRGRPDLEVLLSEVGDEPFFIKNLETIQGDERDDIIISLGYGPTEQGGPPALAFGPLGRQGGERRWNVATTRGRFRTTLVSSIRPEQLDGVRAARWDGPRVLARYVEYAKRGGRFGVDAGGRGEPETEFEAAVKDALTSRGYDVACQVGSSRFRIDLAVRHRDNPHRYIVGIECDGRSYHSSRTARDRDRLRQDILEGMGWRIERVWSTDWIQRPDLVLDKLCRRIEQLLLTADSPGVFATDLASDAHESAGGGPNDDEVESAAGGDSPVNPSQPATTADSPGLFTTDLTSDAHESAGGGPNDDEVESAAGGDSPVNPSQPATSYHPLEVQETPKTTGGRKMVQIVFRRLRETKNTVVFQEDVTDEPPMVGSLYIQKFAVKRLGEPIELAVTIEARDEGPAASVET